MIGDLETAIQKVPGVSYLFFADDVVICVTVSNIRSLEDGLNSSLLNFVIWANTNKMEVSVEKTICELFTLSTKQHLFHLEYKGLPLKYVSLSKYLEINIDFYITYVHPMLDYGCEVVTLVNTSNLEKYDIAQNSGLRIITSGAKSTPITAMQLQTCIEPLDIHRDKFTHKFWERARRVDCKYWNEYR
ncbi:reverse transcriptase domain-containing protein [Trichonephila clavipes]|nr:reverse transcriptase domain-containing protein [Trichonephila clavipes]